MIKLKYSILKSEKSLELGELLSECFENFDLDEKIVRMSIFFHADTNQDYVANKNKLQIKVEELLGSKIPNINYISQKPLGANLYVEIASLDDNTVQYQLGKSGKNSYVNLVSGDYKEVHISGICSDVENSIYKQSDHVFEQLTNILNKESVEKNAIVRQWNYIEQITDFEDGYQHYQQFNDSRTKFYQTAKWVKGYPAATGIGMNRGGVIVECVVTNCLRGIYPIGNPEQIDAHVYSKEVLFGHEQEEKNLKTTPKFERAKLSVTEQGESLFISGTAAIKGETSLAIGEASQQTELTLENIDHLVSYVKDGGYGVNQLDLTTPKFLRAYVKNPVDMEKVKKVCSEIHPKVDCIYLHSDVCRDELLVEIEGVF
jgi:enamine deaminase RidA (YjgF/YER057c/UK114 family)